MSIKNHVLSAAAGASVSLVALVSVLAAIIGIFCYRDRSFGETVPVFLVSLTLIGFVAAADVTVTLVSALVVTIVLVVASFATGAYGAVMFVCIHVVTYIGVVATVALVVCVVVSVATAVFVALKTKYSINFKLVSYLIGLGGTLFPVLIFLYVFRSAFHLANRLYM